MDTEVWVWPVAPHQPPHIRYEKPATEKLAGFFHSGAVDSLVTVFQGIQEVYQSVCRRTVRGHSCCVSGRNNRLAHADSEQGKQNL